MPYLRRPDGCRLWFETWGRAEATPLLMLGGIGDDVAMWRDSLRRLSEAHLVVAADLRGNGRSDAPSEALTIATLAEDAIAVLDHLRMERAHLYGRSLGGMVALELGLGHRTRVRSLVLAATHAGARGAARPDASHRVPKDRPHLALFSDAFARDHRDRVEADRRARAERPQPAHVRRRQWEATRSWDAWDRLSSLSLPVLVLHGTDDRLIPAENARRLAAGIPGASLVLLEPAGHAFEVERPEEADAVVLRFLARVDARGR